MNGDEKEEAQRPRPLSAGIWTLFSWLRRSERSSSSESVSSVGSARTAVSFDFLAPGNCNFTNTPIVLTTALNPPTETYKKRLQERNLRRQRDRDVTLHRKYGLFREYDNGYDGFTLPPARRTLNNTVDRPNRERRATSECLQRRAAYVPGKRRAPLPPAIASSASLPRTYKRKRPAPKPPVKNTLKDNNTLHSISNPDRMTSKSESDATYNPSNELFNSSNKTQKCDKKMNSVKDTKSRSDKNFLKHIFENRKRSSVIETTSVKLLPSISELDKQAFEIIENNKLRQNRNNLKPESFSNLHDKNVLHDGNAWFCTTCLRKYNSSVDSCNYCLTNKGHSMKKDDLKTSSPRSSIYTQTNINVEPASSIRSSVDERNILKEILKEMKDSLPKKNKDSKLNNGITENPTLKIGSTMEETYKDLVSQPSSSSEIIHDKNRILSISSLLSETQRNYDRNNITNQYVLKPSEMRSINHHKVSLGFENEANVQSTSVKVSLNSLEDSSSIKDEQKENKKNADHSPISNKTKKYKLQDISNTKVTKDKNLDSNDLKNTNYTQRHSEFMSTNKFKESNIKNVGSSNETSNNLLSDLQHFKQKNVDNTNNVTDQSKSCKQQFFNLPDSCGVLVNTVTVVTSHLNKNSETSEKNQVKNTEINSTQNGMITVKNESNVPDMKSPSQIKSSYIKNVKDIEPKPSLVKSSEILTDDFKAEYNLHKPLNISSLLNPLDSLRTTVNDNIIRTTNDAGKQIPKKKDAGNIDKAQTKVNEKVISNITSQLIVNSVVKTTCQGNDLKEPRIKETSNNKNSISKDVSINKALPSTSGCFERGTTNPSNNVNNYDQRRHLINQLEQSIAKGDEVAAAEAAVKLAKLRLSCSVLSFSSQIVGDTSGVKENGVTEKHKLAKMENKSLVQSIQETHTETNTPVSNNETITKLPKNKVPPEKEDTKLIKNNESSSQCQTFINEPSSSNDINSEGLVPIKVWIEDKQAARGPITITISRRATMADLRRQAELSLGLATRLQKWIVGRTLCSDDATPIVSLTGPYFRAPFYLCVVQPVPDHNKPVTSEIINKGPDDKDNSALEQNGEFYTELMKLEKQSLVLNIEPFECGVCIEECAAGAGVILRECFHTFCRDCLSDVVQHSQEPAVACPAMGCSGFLQEREIRTIVTAEEYERWLARGLATAECGTRNAFHCRTRDCPGWAFCDPGVRRFPCPVCNNTNCIQCQAIHEGETCEQYQSKLREAVTAAETNKDDEGTQALLNSLISRGEALECPECKAIITKKWGCDWVKCSACKTEICWITKGRRWGPGGRGDTSGGCRCGVDGQRCHPSCGYCH